MLRVLLCMTCCSVPPASRSGKRKSSSNPNLGTKKDEARSGSEAQLSPAELGDANGDSKLAFASNKLTSLAPSEMERLPDDQAPADREGRSPTIADSEQGKLNSKINSRAAEGARRPGAGSQPERHDQSSPVGARPSSPESQRQALANYTSISERDAVERYGDLRVDSSLYDTNGSVSAGSSDDSRPYTESRGERRAGDRPSASSVPASSSAGAEMATAAEAADKQRQLSGPAAGSEAQNVPSTTRIGDYARLEYSPVDDLDSVTTMSYSRLGSERGAGGRSQAESEPSRPESPGRRTGATEESLSRRSSRGGVESTSLSISSQLSNEQFQQNLTNMLESVNPNYQTFGTIGLPLGPPIDAGLPTETTKTSPETPGAALTSASPDSLSEGAPEGSPRASRPATLRSNQSSGGALVSDSLQQERANMEEMAELARPAPLAMGEDEPLGAGPPLASVVTSGRAKDGLADESRPGTSERVGSPQSFTTTTSGALTNPTPTPSELSSGGGKKKRLKAKALFKRFKPGGKSKSKSGDAAV